MAPPSTLLAAALLLGAVRLGAQTPADCWTAVSPPVTDDTARTAAAVALRAVRAQPIRGSAPLIDGRVTEAVWCDATPATDFVQSGPAPGAIATLPTAVRVLFDASAVYVAVRLFDPHPDSIMSPYPRRDDEVTSDWVFVEMDTRFDRRSGFSFGLNPRGVQVDGSWWDDVNYDPAWNGVWQGAASVDSAGWWAEFRIPFSQLSMGRSTPGAPVTWGINVYRTTPHRGETSNWSPRLPSVAGVVSRFNRLEGIAGPPRGARLELVPYGAVTGVSAPSGDKDGMSNRIGGDIRVRPTPATSLLLSLHPDFGQVEADPSQVNLTTFETFLAEQRPLFVEGADVFQFNAGLNFTSRGTSFAEESPFYSRRVGRAPQASLPTGLRAADLPSAASLLGAARFSTRTSSGWSGGAFQAFTNSQAGEVGDALGRHRVQLEPLTGFSVIRASHESRDGEAAVGVMLTGVNRIDQSARVDSQLPRTAYVVGTDARWRRGSNELTGFVMVSRVSGSETAIGDLRAEPRHGYDRGVDPGLVVNHDRLDGMAGQMRFGRTQGNLQWGIAGRLVTQGFEANDAGFQRNANWLLLAGDWQYQSYRPGRWLRRWSIGSSSLGMGWTTAGEKRAANANLTLSANLRSYWGGSFSVKHEFAAADPEVLRGGPSLLLPARDRAVMQVFSDSRRNWQVVFTATGEREPGSASRRATFSPSFNAFVSDRLQLGLIPEVGWVREGWQYSGRATPLAQDSTPRYLLGRLNQREVSLTTRATYAFSSHLTLQWYLQAFLSSGRYDGFSEVRSAKAARLADRVASIAGSRLERDQASGSYLLDPGTDSSATFPDPAFSERSLNHSLVLRWEFLPGSTLFLVWTQARGDQLATPFQLGRDLRRLMHAAPTNALELKVSYWIAA